MGARVKHDYPVGFKAGKRTVTGSSIRKGIHMYYPVLCECGRSDWVAAHRVTVSTQCVTCRYTPKVRLPKPPKQRHNVRLLTIDGETKTCSEWLKHPDCHISRSLLSLRLKHGGDPKQAVFDPLGRAGRPRPANLPALRLVRVCRIQNKMHAELDRHLARMKKLNETLQATMQEAA
jgi:hypothetical protein